MFSNRVFLITFMISLITHGVILFQVPKGNFFPALKKEKNLEVSYIKVPLENKADLETKEQKKEDFLKFTSKITVDKKIPPPFINKENIFKVNKSIVLQDTLLAKPTLIKTDVSAIKKKVILPQIDLDKNNNPSYISYYQIVREKIRRSAYQNYTRQETGEVYLSFIISNDGYLKEIRLVEEKSSSEPYLREIASRSIRDASPFPNFPKELDYPQLSFNVIISFEIE